MKQLFNRITVSTALLAGLVASTAAWANQDVFSVKNTTDSRITRLLMSGNGRDWGYFEVGKGIAPGATMQFTWGKNTGNEACEQIVVAVFADGSKSEPAKIDMCDSDILLEF